MPVNSATKAFSYTLARFWVSFCCKLYNILLSRMRISQNLAFFFWRIHFQFFSRFFCFPFSLPFFSLYLLPFIPFLSTGKVLALALLKTWKSNIDQLGDLAYFTTISAPKIGHVSSARIWSIFKMNTCMDGSVLAVLAAHQNNLVMSKMMMSQVVQFLRVKNITIPKIRLSAGKS